MTLLVVCCAGAAQAQVTNGAPIVHLRKDCTGFADCFADSDTDPNDGLAALQLWIWDGASPRNPGDGDPLLVDIGPGAFVGTIACPSVSPPADPAGHVTFRGAGRERTRITAASGSAVTATNCTKLGFQDLTVQSGSGAYDIAVAWGGDGDSDWSDVDFEGRLAAWFDTSCSGDPASDGFSGEHYFWDPRFRAEAWGISSECGQSWVYGGEIEVAPTPGSTALTIGWAGVAVAHRGDVRLFGSKVHVTADAIGGSSSEAFYGVRAGLTVNAQVNPSVGKGYGDFHFHGGVISVDSSAVAGADATAMANQRFQVPLAESTLTHTPGTVFEVVAGAGGEARRLWGGAGAGRVLSPHLWAPGTAPPAVTTLAGKDLYVETDCGGPGGACSGAAVPEPHLIISWPDECASGWWDTAEGSTGACYQP